jgi:hypothetical protein
MASAKTALSVTVAARAFIGASVNRTSRSLKAGTSTAETAKSIRSRTYHSRPPGRPDSSSPAQCGVVI